MKTSEFPAVIAARNVAMAELEYFNLMMSRSNSGKASPSPSMKTSEFESVIEARKLAEKQLEYFYKMSEQPKRPVSDK